EAGGTRLRACLLQRSPAARGVPPDREGAGLRRGVAGNVPLGHEARAAREGPAAAGYGRPRAPVAALQMSACCLAPLLRQGNAERAPHIPRSGATVRPPGLGDPPHLVRLR